MKTQDFDLIQDSKIDNANSKSVALKEYRSLEEIQDWVLSYVADLLEVEPDEIDITIPFSRYGLDSSAAVGLTGDLEDWLGVEIDPTLLYDYPTIESLVKYLTSQFN